VNKKYVLMVIIMTISIIGQAQSKKKKSKQRAIYSIGISGGYFMHGEIFKNSANDFAGLKFFQIDAQKLHKSKKSGFSLGYLSKKAEYIPFGSSVDESRFAFILNYNVMFNTMKNGNQSGLYLGGFVGLIYDRGEQLSRGFFAFPVNTTYSSLWIGPKAEYLYQINPKLALSASAQLGLLEFGRQSINRDDPILPESAQTKTETYFSFGKRINLNLGINITL